jgi:UDP-N-acetylglucosamine--N-acetylmuramyl-(pentapeptide) pyrophosphoryl-undecaprenol N-acetylglucosamine transferase
MAGGTGGHVFPALAIADYFEKRNYDIFWLGGVHGLERKLVKIDPVRMLLIRFSGVRKNGALRWLFLPFTLITACFDAVRFLIKVKPDVAIGFGGYVTVPGGIAAALYRCPIVIHEQNAFPGLANRLLAKISKKVLLGFPGAFSEGVHVGNPLRPAFEGIKHPAVRYEERNGCLTIVIVGGSLGSQTLNKILPVAISKIPIDRRPCIIHQAGRNNLDELRSLYDRFGVDAILSEFIENMPDVYSRADLVISRAGALTVSEISAVGVASMLVPYPHAVDDHQTKNGEFLEKLGAAIIVPEADMTPELIADYLLKTSRDQLKLMAINAKSGGSEEATALAGRHIEELIL